MSKRVARKISAPPRSGRIEKLAIAAIRMLALDMVEEARSGHPGLPLGAAPMAYVLWTRFLRFNPKDPAWPDRDRFILSAGHGSALLYSLLHLTGFDLPLEELKHFRRWGSRTPGHPETRVTPGVEATTGPLGQGFANGVGMAIAARAMAERFNRPSHEIVGHRVFAIVSDGDLMEGISSEAASLAGHLKLGRLIYLYDDNRITIEGGTELAFTEDVGRRFKAYGWHVQRVADGNDTAAVDAALCAACEEEGRPSLIAVRTHIGFGSPRQDDASAHGEPLGDEAAAATRRFYGWPQGKPFFVPDEARAHLAGAIARGRRLEDEWLGRLAKYRRASSAEAAGFDRWISGGLPDGWDARVPAFGPGEAMATRDASGKTLNAIAEAVDNIIGGSADLAPSTKARIAGTGDFGADKGGRNIRFGVREHAMGGIVNGMAMHGGVIPYGATFLAFSDYMRPAVRLAALQGAPSIFIFTHDSVGLGEDGPTHQPIEHLMSLRAIPNLVVIRPADANETAAAWRIAIERRDGPTAIALTRQKLPILDPSYHPILDGVRRGAYVLADASGPPDTILIATGSEVHLALEAKVELAVKGVGARVISMPSWELFERQPQAYRDEVLPPSVAARLSIEAGATLGWHRWVGARGAAIGLDRFGASAPGGEAMERLGFTAKHVVARALTSINISQAACR